MSPCNLCLLVLLGYEESVGHGLDRLGGDLSPTRRASYESLASFHPPSQLGECAC